MNKRTNSFVPMLITGLLTGVLLVAMLGFKSTPAAAHMVPVPCDFTTGGGFVITDSGNHANFGLVAGCKNGGFFGHVNFVDHDPTGTFAGLHVSSDQITAYVDPFPTSRYRDICGTACTNLFGEVYFRARTLDVAEPGSGPHGPGRFGIELTGISALFRTATGRERVEGTFSLGCSFTRALGSEVTPLYHSPSFELCRTQV